MFLVFQNHEEYTQMMRDLKANLDEKSKGRSRLSLSVVTESFVRSMPNQPKDFCVNKLASELKALKKVRTTTVEPETVTSKFNALLLSDMHQFIDDFKTEIFDILVSIQNDSMKDGRIYDELNDEMHVSNYFMDIWVADKPARLSAYLSMSGPELEERLDDAYQVFISEREKVDLSFDILRMRTCGFAYRELIKDMLLGWTDLLESDFNDSFDDGVLHEVHTAIKGDDKFQVAALLKSHLNQYMANEEIQID